MAQPPRKSSASRRPQETPAPDDLFAGDAATPPAEEWTLDDPSPTSNIPSRPRVGSLPAQPILPAATEGFESNPQAQADESSGHPAEVKPPATLASPPEPEAVTHDPFHIDDELPVLPPAAPAPAAPRERETEPEPGFESPASPEETETAPSPPRQDRVGLATAAALLMALLAIFGMILYTNRPASGTANARTLPDLPIAGKIMTITDLKSGWHSRQPADRVSTVDVTLPTPSRQQPALLPQVQFSCDPTSSKNGFLRFIFFDPEGKISGDVRVVKLAGGNIDPLSSGAVVAGPGSALVYGSLGFMDRPGFVAYASGSSPRWSVEVSESSDYNAKEAGWTLLQTFDIRNVIDP